MSTLILKPARTEDATGEYSVSRTKSGFKVKPEPAFVRELDELNRAPRASALTSSEELARPCTGGSCFRVSMENHLNPFEPNFSRKFWSRVWQKGLPFDC